MFLRRLLILACFFMFATGANATVYTWEQVLQSPVDETYFGNGDSRNKFDPDNLSIHPITLEGEQGVGKRNGGYVWGLTSYKDDIWYGINDNGWCDWLIAAGVPMFGQAALGIYGQDSNSILHSYSTAVAGCSHDPMENRKAFTRFYYFDTKTKVLERVTSDNQKFKEHSNGTLAIRSAGTYGNMVFLAGLRSESFYSDSPELAVFVFNADTHEYIDSVVLKGFANIRRMQAFTHPDGTSAMYLSAGNETGRSNYENYLLRWVGTPTAPFVGGGNGTRTYIRDTFSKKGAGCLDADFTAKTNEWTAKYNTPELQREFVRIGDVGACADPIEGRTITLVLNEIIDGFNVAVANYGEQTGLYSEIEPYTDQDSNKYIVMTSWNSATKSGGLYISDLMPSGGFAALGHDEVPYAPAKFNKIMLMSEFEPDPLLGTSWFTGFLSVYKGYAYWGTMMTPAVYATVIGATLGCNYGAMGGVCTNMPLNINFTTGEVIDHNRSLCTGSPEKVRACMTNGIRAAQVFRTKLDGKEIPTLSYADTEMLYGDECFTAIDPLSFMSPYGLSWTKSCNSLGMKPKYGNAGITSRSNVYAWASTVYKDKLYMGTMDISNGQRDYLESPEYKDMFSKDTFVFKGTEYKGWNPDTENIMAIQAVYNYYKEKTKADGRELVDGGDFFVFEDEKSPAKLISDNAMGNPYLTGFRNFTVVNDEMYLGTTSMANIGPQGGYSIFKFTPSEQVFQEIKSSSSGGCSIGGANSSITGVLVLFGIIAAFVFIRRKVRQ